MSKFGAVGRTINNFINAQQFIKIINSYLKAFVINIMNYYIIL